MRLVFYCATKSARRLSADFCKSFSLCVCITKHNRALNYLFYSERGIAKCFFQNVQLYLFLYSKRDILRSILPLLPPL